MRNMRWFLQDEKSLPWRQIRERGFGGREWHRGVKAHGTLETGALGDAGVWDTLVVVAREETREAGSSEQEIWHTCQRPWTLSRNQGFSSSCLLDRLHQTPLRDC